ncbi:G_PROTEIN_RECEP_F1_2 domain-containing protein [Caenorhabditis elegans]|uniref:G_PROTEIN_RECEP_F1_2 domain-containing protein n=1 Tax=Caenorhabditis elegans TaxID=6239 RepID=Q9XV86_CAEEL|nr:G_PROTEIN_RECEP_F1_2 domain-containing protein [Caenorhabditis elegans]CAB04139.2 G_PROTEIN_RECEP_F1_2 domain-containing protein [Caenorhabditis elegans]|eukprot:NP_001309457.1 Serpentine Receptor, class W [Caenorhabditis elegans]
MNQKLLHLIEHIANYVFYVEFVVSIFGFIFTLPHLFILTRKSMRTSCTNSIMMGIAIVDIIVLLEIILNRAYGFWILENPCLNYESYNFELFLLIGEFLGDTGERTSFCLGVFLVLIRLIITKLRGSADSLSSSVFGYIVFILLLILHSLISYSFYSTFFLREWPFSWKPNEKCIELPQNYSEKVYIRASKVDIILFDPAECYNFITGLSKIVVSVMYPVLALMLILDIRKSAKTASSLSEKRAKERYHSGRMILVMTIFYTIASAPGGIANFIEVYIEIPTDSLLMVILGQGSIFFQALFCFNSASHCLINFSMSTNYRNTVKMAFGFQKNDVLTVSRKTTRATKI